MPWISSNKFLNQTEMQQNAEMVYQYFICRGWSKNAIAGLLGNMQVESTINPGIWQSLNINNMNGGYGLVQWTPASKYITWAGSNYANGNKQCERIIWEMNNNQQYYKTKEHNISFKKFSTSKLSPETLADAFLKNYERPALKEQPKRGEYARYWFNYLGGDNVEKLVIDGYLGPKTIKAMQRHFGTPVDGIISKPSLVIKEMQKALNKGKF